MFLFNYSVFECFEHSSVHPQEELYMQFYGIPFMHPYKQSARWQDVFECHPYMKEIP